MTAYLEIDTLLKNKYGIGFDLDEADHTELQRILIIDDETEFVDLTKQLLRISGFTVMSAMSSADVYLKISEYHPHLILLNYGMKSVVASILLRQLRQF